MRLIHPVTGQWREVQEPKLPKRLLPGGGISMAAGNITAVGKLTPPGLPEAMQRVIRPEAQPRWLLPSMAMMTPQFIEAILRGALNGNHVMQWQLFDLMEDTWPRLAKNLNELKDAAIGKLLNHWRLAPWAKKDEAPGNEAIQKAALIEEALFGMRGKPQNEENGFESTLYDMADAWAKGVSLLEIDWEQRVAGDLGDFFAPKDTYWVSPRNYAWGSDGRMGLVLPESYADGGATRTGQRSYSGYIDTSTRMPTHPAGASSEGFIEIPEDKFLVCISKARTGHALGGARLRVLAWWWCASNFSAEWLLNFAQIFGIPMRWANYAPSAPQETVDKICEILANMGSQAWAAFPAGTTMELKEASGGNDHSPQADMLDRCDKQCDLLILGQTLTTQVSREGGNRALGEVHERKEQKNEDALARFLATVLNNQFIPAILRLNFDNEDEKPSFVQEDEDPADAKENAEVLQIAVNMGVRVPMKFALEKLNIPAAEPGEETLSPVQQGQDLTGANGGPSRTGQDQQSANFGATRTGQCGHAQLNATDKLTESVVENLTGVEAKWLAGVKPFFKRLVLLAQSKSVTDADLVRELQNAKREMPDLLKRMDTAAVRDALEAAMGAAVVNGAVRGAMQRRISTGGNRGNRAEVAQ